jgi:hypothetical protein
VLLRADVHTLFDLHMIGIDPECANLQGDLSRVVDGDVAPTLEPRRAHDGARPEALA